MDARTQARRFELQPFRGLRFDPAKVGDLGSVVSPPYDVLDSDLVHDLEAANRHNIVRLILSRRFEAPYQRVRHRLDQWRSHGYLRPDPDPALYLYEYAVERTTVRGLIGLVGLRDESEGIVLPHEDVLPGPVDDRVILMATTRTNPEPILLVHAGADATRRLLDTVAARDPLAEFTAFDGSHHRLWPVTDPGELAQVAGQLAGTTALIADGHHRYAAYQRLQHQERGPDQAQGDSRWDYGLAMLIDQGGFPLRIGPIHRSIDGLTFADVQDLAAESQAALTPYDVPEAALAAQRAADPHQAAFVVSDGRTWGLLATPRTSRVDVVVLHRELLPRWNVSEAQLSYHHAIEPAVHSVAQRPGLVVAVSPPTLEDVMSAATHGERLPRKSTSFGPKPRMGVVLRDLRDE